MRNSGKWLMPAGVAALIGFASGHPAVLGVELSEGLVAEWTFDQGRGNIVRDTSDNNNNGILHNGAKCVDAGIGKALRLDGVDDYVDCGATALVDLTEKVSLEAWVNPAEPSAGEPLIVGKGIYSYGLTWSGTVLIFYISDGAWKCAAEIPMDTWSHVVGTYDGTRMLLYVNGALTSGFVMDKPNTPIKSRGTSVLLGRRGQGYYAGMIDNVRIYNRPLSAREVREHYNAERKLLKTAAAIPREKLKGIARVVHDIGRGRKTLVVSAVETIESDLTIPSNICLRFEMPGRFVVAEGATLKINGPLQAPLTQLFGGQGKVVFGKGCVEKVYPQWWGARADGVADDSGAIQSAIGSRPAGGVISFPGGTYNVGRTIKFHNGITLAGPARLRSKKALPAILQSFNPAARTGGLKILAMKFDGRAVNGDRSAIGIDLTNTCSSTLQDVGVSSCGIGIKMDGPIFCGYNNLIRISVGACDTGIEMSNSTIKTALMASNIGAVGTGVLVKTANELDIFGLSIEGFRHAGIDIRRGDTIHMHHLYFANGETSGTGIRIAPGVSECTIINPRFSRVATPIDDQGPDTLVLDNQEPSQILRTKALFAAGISAGDLGAKNLRGQAAISGASTRVSVKFEVPEPDEKYYAVATVVSASKGVPSGATNVRIHAKAPTGFELIVAEPPGKDRKVKIDWILIR